MPTETSDTSRTLWPPGPTSRMSRLDRLQARNPNSVAWTFRICPRPATSIENGYGATGVGDGGMVKAVRFANHVVTVGGLELSTSHAHGSAPAAPSVAVKNKVRP